MWSLITAETAEKFPWATEECLVRCENRKTLHPGGLCPPWRLGGEIKACLTGRTASQDRFSVVQNRFPLVQDRFSMVRGRFSVVQNRFPC